MSACGRRRSGMLWAAQLVLIVVVVYAGGMPRGLACVYSICDQGEEKEGGAEWLSDGHRQGCVHGT